MMIMITIMYYAARFASEPRVVRRARDEAG